MTRPLSIALAALLLLAAGCELAERDQAPPNFVLIFADDVGYGDLSSYGHPTIRTPNLDGMAHAGIKLTSFYVAAPACSPSRAALLTGRYPIRTGILWALGPDEDRGIDDSEITLAEALGAYGYRTAAIGKWHLGARDRYLPTRHGFDSYFGLLYSNDMMPPWVGTERPLELWRDTLQVEHPVDQTTLTRRYTEEAVRFIGESRGRPFFLYLAHSMAHVPLHRSPEFEGVSRGGRYGDVIEEIDWSVGRILEALRESGVEDNTLVVFTSDNGPWMYMPDRMFLEDKIKPWDAGSAGPLRGAKAGTYEGGVRVPFIAYWPGRIAPRQVSSELAVAMDLYTTLVELAGAELPDDRPLDGKNIMPLLESGAGSPHEYFFYVYPRRLEAVRDAEWKLRITGDSSDRIVTELFHLTVDPYERFNVADQHPEVVERLKSQMTRFAEETGATLASASLPR